MVSISCASRGKQSTSAVSKDSYRKGIVSGWRDTGVSTTGSPEKEENHI